MNRSVNLSINTQQRIEIWDYDQDHAFSHIRHHPRLSVPQRRTPALSLSMFLSSLRRCSARVTPTELSFSSVAFSSFSPLICGRKAVGRRCVYVYG